jgi:hypothetical protein
MAFCHGTEMLKASTGSSGSTAQIERPIRGVVEARSLTGSFDDSHYRFDAKLCRANPLKSHLLLCHSRYFQRKYAEIYRNAYAIEVTAIPSP